MHFYIFILPSFSFVIARERIDRGNLILFVIAREAAAGRGNLIMASRLLRYARNDRKEGVAMTERKGSQ